MLIAGGVIALFVSSGLEWREIHAAMTRLNPFAVFALMATLPLAGFSIGIVYLVAGAKFGPILGGVLVAAATAVHLIGSHWIARSFLRAPLERFFARRHHHLPELPPDEYVAISAMAALVPGLPYFARNYLLALAGIPLRVYFWVCLPIYVIRSYLVIFLGDLSGDPSPRQIFWLGFFYVVKLAICGYLILHIRRRYKRSHPPAAPQPS